MPLYLDKILAQLAYPLGTALILALLGLLLLGVRRRRLGVAGMVLAVAWLWFWSLPVVADALRLSLEGRFAPQRAEELPAADFIVLLGGGVRGVPADWPYPDLNAAADRVWHAPRLYHADKAPLIIVSGGGKEWHGERGSEAEAMRELLLAFGVPDGAIRLEDRSRSTRENALYTAPLVGERPVLLVTSAQHMPRSLATFRAVGINAVPAPTDFEVIPQPLHSLRLLPDAHSLHQSTSALKEYLGLLVYRLRGWA